YYVTGLYRGAYELDTSTAAPASLDDAASTFSSAEVAEDDAGLPSTWSLADAAATIDAVSQEHPVNENGSYEQSVEAWEGNLASGFITQEEYDRFVQEAQTYAQIID
ncbi:MAG: hypothetical protein Q4D42_12225, partial [Eubacteriales bacterium]|nr:hypothetical protein [Eubacteriales bacterium]